MFSEKTTILKNRLQKLRKLNRMTQRDVSDALNIPRSTYSGYEKGYREMGYDTLVDVATFFDVSVDYLLGITDKPKYEPPRNAKEILEMDRINWNGIPLDEDDLEMIKNILQNVARKTNNHITT